MYHFCHAPTIAREKMCSEGVKYEMRACWVHIPHIALKTILNTITISPAEKRGIMKKRNERNKDQDINKNNLFTIIFILIISTIIGVSTFFYFYDFDSDVNIKKYFSTETIQ